MVASVFDEGDGSDYFSPAAVCKGDQAPFMVCHRLSLTFLETQIEGSSPQGSG